MLTRFGVFDEHGELLQAYDTEPEAHAARPGHGEHAYVPLVCDEHPTQEQGYCQGCVRDQAC